MELDFRHLNNSTVSFDYLLLPNFVEGKGGGGGSTETADLLNKTFAPPPSLNL